MKFRTSVCAPLLGSLLSPILAVAGSAKQAPTRVVVHVNFDQASRQEHGFGNVENILKESVDGKNVELIAHGEGIWLLVKDKSKLSAKIAELSAKGIRFAACDNTMQKKNISRDQLLPGVSTVSSAAFEIIKKQQDGYSYFRP